MISQIIISIFYRLTEAVAKLRTSTVTRDRESPGATTMSSIHRPDLVLDVDDLALGAVGSAGNVERHE